MKCHMLRRDHTRFWMTAACCALSPGEIPNQRWEPINFHNITERTKRKRLWWIAHNRLREGCTLLPTHTHWNAGASLALIRECLGWIDFLLLTKEHWCWRMVLLPYLPITLSHLLKLNPFSYFTIIIKIQMEVMLLPCGIRGCQSNGRFNS